MKISGAPSAKRRHGAWMQTYTGKAYFTHDPDPKDVCIDDIAHALSMLCRFTGHTKRFYSVAEHSVHVMQLVPVEHRLVALMHDATEAYLNDLSRPLKMGLAEYKKIEELNWYAIAETFELELELPACVKEADATMVWLERRALMAPMEGPSDWGLGKTEPKVYPDLGPMGWSPANAKTRFRHEFDQLVGARK
jgi:uncharacterized protein